MCSFENCSFKRARCAIAGWNLTHKKGLVLFHGKPRRITHVIPAVVSSYICTLSHETIVLGADAYDTLFSASSKPQDILKTFSKFKEDFVWSAESNMWHPFSSLPPFVKKAYSIRKPTKYPYRFLNYGGWIGKSKEACRILKLGASQLENCQLCRCRSSTDCKLPQQDQGAAHIVFRFKKGAQY